MVLSRALFSWQAFWCRVMLVLGLPPPSDLCAASWAGRTGKPCESPGRLDPGEGTLPLDPRFHNDMIPEGKVAQVAAPPGSDAEPTWHCWAIPLAEALSGATEQVVTEFRKMPLSTAGAGPPLLRRATTSGTPSGRL